MPTSPELSWAHAFVGAALASPFDDVRLWLVDLDSVTTPSVEAWLSPSEHERARKFVFPRDAQRYRAAHAVLRCLLRQECGWPPGAEFEIGRHGKPEVRARAPSGFNLAHSGAYALIGIGDGDGIGVDIEMLRPIDDLRALAELNLSANELREFRRTPTSDLGRAFLRGWTRKEACLKALGSGLNAAPKGVDVGLDSASRTLRVELDSGPAEVCVRNVEAGEDLLVAVADRATGEGARSPS